ncbi:exodeoxyribonuclease V subunit alpha [Dokdonella immobilis]|uniref:RecBCD enzyme subunit RecD n=1 Tax=Dokdonella immobilis TaxID=578942 RepID=A0A1I5AGF0_9GAMM|nr:exodeoxyribonuclease V subunit alpha [Dokdonella immobilis]SFN61472.1 DNA helicase/exodeoxyribonuclease V, alpha subunit [Dokdonella immobilis]
MNAFDDIREDGFSALDAALIEAFRSIWPGSDEAALHLAALASWATARGHSCFTPDLLDDWSSPGESTARERRILAWHAQLRAGDWPEAPFIGPADSQAPIVVEGRRAWLRRYWRYEREIEAALRARALAVAGLPPAVDVAAALDALLPSADHGEIDWQRVAAATALRAPLTVICGGPGTGKTFTALRVLALVRHFADAPLRMALAAPTGKAAQRLSESVQLGLRSLPLSDAQRADLPSEAMTLHRLLGFHAQSVQPMRDSARPLDLDVLVVDECSMVDLPLMAKLLRALKPECRLVLLGDPDQLPAVENGAVLAALAACNTDNRFADETARWIGQASGERVAAGDDRGALAERIVRLERPRRFGGASGIARLVRAIRTGDAGAVFDILGDSADIVWSEAPWRIDASAVRRQLHDSYRVLAEAETPAAALEALGRYRILCALREGPQGVSGLNRTVANALHGAVGEREFVHGRPILVTSNHHALGLYNGDVGVFFRERPESPLRAWFARRDGDVHALLPAQLPAHDSAYAMTVHKAQGSEFDTVELVLPEQPHPLLTREWLYTAASRARSQLRIHASREVIGAALARRTRRINGLDLLD